MPLQPRLGLGFRSEASERKRHEVVASLAEVPLKTDADFDRTVKPGDSTQKKPDFREEAGLRFGDPRVGRADEKSAHPIASCGVGDGQMVFSRFADLAL